MSEGVTFTPFQKFMLKGFVRTYYQKVVELNEFIRDQEDRIENYLNRFPQISLSTFLEAKAALILEKSELEGYRDRFFEWLGLDQSQCRYLTDPGRTVFL